MTSAGTKAEAPEVSLGPLSVANEVLLKLESSRHLKLDQLAETDVRELAHLLRTNNEVASRVQRLARCLPQVQLLLAARSHSHTRAMRVFFLIAAICSCA